MFKVQGVECTKQQGVGNSKNCNHIGTATKDITIITNTVLEYLLNRKYVQ